MKSPLKKTACLRLARCGIASLLLACPAAVLAAIPHLVPSYKSTQTLVASANLADKNYLAFPILLRLSETELLIGYKRGAAHFRDQEADWEILRFNPVTRQVAPHPLTFHKPGVNLQNGEFVRFQNGEIACYLDVQAPNTAVRNQTVRLGLSEFRSADGGQHFKEVDKPGIIDGVEYGYVFEAVTGDHTTWMLAMTFSNLVGGDSVFPGRPIAGSVHVIRTEDNGRNWRFVKNLTREFGNIPINESSLLRRGDGFIITCRGYDDRQWLQLTDLGFNLKRQAELTKQHPEIRAYLARPRLFAKDGGFYVMGRNYTGPQANQTSAPGTEPKNQKRGPMRLGLFRFDPDTLTLINHVILDNAEGIDVSDGYYAAPYWETRDGRTFFNVVTYKRVADRKPNIERFEFDWNEIR